jgi:hypothetical protein
MADDEPIRFRPDKPLAAWLAQSSALAMTGLSPSLQAKGDLGLLRMILDTELRRVRLTLPQANCLADIMNGTIIDSAIGAGLGLAYAECYDGFRLAREHPMISDSSYGAKWAPEGTDPVKFEQDLLEVLGGLGPAADYALRRAVAAWWAGPGMEEAETVEAQIAAFAAVGLRVTEGQARVT